MSPATARSRPPAETRILIVEDDVYFQRILEKRLEADGYQIATAADGREGMKLIVTWNPDLVVSDWMMPHVDGLELCQAVKTGLKETAPYFILLTAKDEISDRLLGLDTGADDYLVKPCDQGEILARIRAGLRNVLLARELQVAMTELERAQARLGVRGPDRSLARCRACRRVGVEGAWLELDAWIAGHGGVTFHETYCRECERDRSNAAGAKPEGHPKGEGRAREAA